MSDLTLFDARPTDPPSSHRAARAVRPAREELIAAIRAVVGQSRVPLTQFDIASAVLADSRYATRWAEGTVRTRCSDARLREVDVLGWSPRGLACARYRLDTQ